MVRANARSVSATCRLRTTTSGRSAGRLGIEFVAQPVNMMAMRAALEIIALPLRYGFGGMTIRRNAAFRVFAGVVAAALAMCVYTLSQSQAAPAPVDPGVRGGAPGAGTPLEGLTADETAFFQNGLAKFLDIESVTGGENNGLGPRFNSNQCLSCHSQPSVGGSSPATNPLIAIATLEGARNVVPWFITQNGPIREARFKRNPNGTNDGGVHNLFVITGRRDAEGCKIAQPNFRPAGNPLTGKGGNPNIVFRIPTPVFGAGLIEAVPDSAILANMKAEAYNVEMGVTSQLFPQERDETPGCVFNATPEDTVNFTPSRTTSKPNTAVISDVEAFADFMRMLAPPTPAPDTPSTVNGRAIFAKVGCAFCHTPSLTTGKAIASGSSTSPSRALSNRPVNLFSDLLVHNMGRGLADGITQGGAGPDEFRTAPLWGVGQRIFFLHDGRTTNLIEAIKAHRSRGSEASKIVERFNRLSTKQQQDLIDFLRSL